MSALFLMPCMVSLMKISMSSKALEILLCLEMLMSSTVMMMVTVNLSLTVHPYVTISILCFMVCESSIGLSIVASTNMNYSQFNMKNLTFTKIYLINMCSMCDFQS